jgi:23S rRNA (uracil747-C5)-methyltransferase
MTVFCNYYEQGICRSCTQLPIPYPEQLLRKENQLITSLAAVTSLCAPSLTAITSTSPASPQKNAHITLLPTRSGPLQGFRNKIKMSVAGTTAEPLIGILHADDLDQGKEILDCPVHHPQLNLVLHALKIFIPLAKLVPYQVSQRRGELKGLISFYSPESNEMYLRFILRSTESLERIRKYAPALLSEFPFLTCITGNIQPIPHAILEGTEEILLAGQPTITHRLGNLNFKIRPQGFVQTNQIVAQQLYETAAEWMKEMKTQRLVELFCGQGAFSFFAKDVIAAGLGIEINAEAVAAANLAAQNLQVPYLHFQTADAAKVESALQAFAPDTVLVNPPRRGLGHSIALLQNSAFPYLIYSSCSHQSLAKDLQQLPQYEIKKIQIFDLFPHTEHFETLVLLKSKMVNA